MWWFWFRIVHLASWLQWLLLFLLEDTFLIHFSSCVCFYSSQIICLLAQFIFLSFWLNLYVVMIKFTFINSELYILRLEIAFGSCIKFRHFLFLFTIIMDREACNGIRKFTKQLNQFVSDNRLIYFVWNVYPADALKLCPPAAAASALLQLLIYHLSVVPILLFQTWKGEKDNTCSEK